MKKVEIYTDGACSGNPGPGGYAAVLVYGDSRKEISGGFRWTTNNRMELLAVVEGLSLLKYECDVSIYSDSNYIVRAFNEHWLEKWQRNGWRTANKAEVQNSDLWRKLLAVLENHTYRFVWVKGHSGHIENSRCDELAVAASKQSDVAIDAAYEAINPYNN